MKYLLPVIRMLAAVSVISVIFIQSSPAADAGNDPGRLRIELEENLLTLEARDASLLQILNRLGEVAGFKVIVVDKRESPVLVNVNIEKAPLEKAISQLLRDSKRIIYYLPEEKSNGNLRISQIWLLGSENKPVDRVIPDDVSTVYQDLEHDDSRIRSEAALTLAAYAKGTLQEQDARHGIRAELIKKLQTDPDALVRSRAAIALGVMGDEESVIALELAIQDPHFSVSTQAITALGQIGSEQAVASLGSVLIDDTVSSTKRIIAAQALWKQDTESAAEYLRIGAADANKQVRLASSNPPHSLKNNPARRQTGPVETE